MAAAASGVSHSHRNPTRIPATCIVAVALALVRGYFSAAYAFTPPSLATLHVSPPSEKSKVPSLRRVGRHETAAYSSTGTSTSTAQRKRTGLISRRARVRPRPGAGTGNTAAISQSPTSPDAPDTQQRPGSEGGGNAGDLVRIEVAQRLKELKLMTQPEAAAPLATAEAGLMDPETLDDVSTLEWQISLLSARIGTIAKHVQATPTDAVSRKGLVALVKRRRFLLETLRHRDNARWLATTEKLGLRQRPDKSEIAGARSSGSVETDEPLTRRGRRRERGKAKRQRGLKKYKK